MQLAPSLSRSKVRGLYLFSLNEPQMSLLLVRMMVGAGLVSGPPREDKRGKGGAWQTARVSWSSVIRQFGLGGGEGPLPSHCSVLACCRDYRESPRSGPFIVPKYDLSAERNQTPGSAPYSRRKTQGSSCLELPQVIF